MLLYDLFVQISNLLGQPFRNLAYVTENVPFLAALFLGIVGAMAPCQFTGNLGALTIYTNETLKRRNVWKDVGFYLTGKVIAFSLLGCLVWLLGQEFQRSLTLYFPYIRKLIGPMYVLIGVYLLGFIKIHGNITILQIPDR
jgi:cytochrome c-type biogenesis protein